MYYEEAVITKNVDVLFREYRTYINRKNLKDLRGRIQFQDDYNYKSLRERA